MRKSGAQTRGTVTGEGKSIIGFMLMVVMVR